MKRRPRWSSLATSVVLSMLSACGGCGGGSEEREPVSDVLFRPFVGTLRVLFIPVQYEDDDGPLMNEVQTEEHAAVVADSFERNAYGRLTVAIEVTPLLVMPRSGASYEEGPSLVRLRADALAEAGRAGFETDGYDLVVIFGVVHWPTAASGIGALDNRTVFINRINPRLTVHEMGHAMGFGHANFRTSREGSAIEVLYADEWDPMGGGGGEPPDVAENLHFNPWFKFRSGWLGAESVAEVSASGSLELTAFEDAPSGAGFQALRVPRDGSTDYWVFLRTDTGDPVGGPLVTLGYRSHNLNIMQSRLLDMTPDSIPDSEGTVLDWRDAGLAEGATFEDGEAGLALTVTRGSDRTATVEVTVSRAPRSAVPSVEFVHTARGGVVQGSFEYLVRAADPDVGALNGDGIEGVQLLLFNMFDDGMLLSIREGEDLPGTHYAVADTPEPPYRLTVDTTTLDDGVYALVAVVTSEDGETATMLAPHFIDNTGPSAWRDR